VKHRNPSRNRPATRRISEPVESLSLADGLRISFMRTLRIPDDGKTYPLPPGLGRFPLYRADDFNGAVPAHWLSTPGDNYFMPLYQREALWIAFDCSPEHPFAIKVGAGNVDAITGKIWDDDIRKRIKLSRRKQNYLVVPAQRWLDGFKTARGAIRQFVAMPLGMGYTVEGQSTGSEDFGGLQLVIVSPHREMLQSLARETMGFARGSEVLYSNFDSESVLMSSLAGATAGPSPAPPGQMAAEVGLGMGGSMNQNIERDTHDFSIWNAADHKLVNVWMVNSTMFRQVTGTEPPATPVTAEEYTRRGYPWFSLYEEALNDVKPSKRLKKLKSVKELDAEHGFGALQDDTPVELKPSQVVKIRQP